MKKSIFGMLLTMESLFMGFVTLVALYYNYTQGETDWKAFAITTGVTFVFGTLLTAYGHTKVGRRNTSLSRGGSVIIVGLTWIIFSLFGMLPFILYEGLEIDVVGAFFETMNGFTTTGSSVLSNLESLPHGILLWRSMMQWMGGLGIVVFSFALLPFSDMKNSNMIQAEMTGISLSRLTPKIGATARRLLLVYLLLTFACAVMYWLGPMDLYDAVNHAMTTISTGGYSTHTENLGYFHSAYIEYVAATFMMLSAINFSLYYFMSIWRGRVVYKNEELRAYLLMFVGLLATFCLLFHFATPVNGVAMPTNGEEVFRTSLFHVSSIFTSTAFAGQQYDYVAWGSAFWMPTLVMMIIGGCAGSTSGGVKMVRVLVYLKYVMREFKLHLHPHAVISIKMNGQVIQNQHVRRSISYLIFFVLLLIVGTAIFTMMFGYDMNTSFSACLSCFSNVGPALGELGPAGNYADVPTLGKLILCALMLIGRLEIFTVLFLFMPKAWRL